MTGFRHFRITEELLIQLFAPGSHARGYEITEGGVPHDARIVGQYYDSNGQLNLTLASDSWEALPQGAAIPVLNTTVRML